MSGVLSAEWLKIRTVRSTYGVLAAMVLATLFAVLLDLYGASVWERLLPASRPGYATMMAQAVTLPITQLSAAVFGVLAATSEYATGTIRAGLIAVPRRGPLLAAKAAVVAGAAFLLGVVIMGATSLGGRAIIGDRVASQPELPRAITLAVASSASVMVYALLGLGLGLLLRWAVAAIPVIVVLWYPLPLVTEWLPTPWNARIGSFTLLDLPPEVAGYHLAGPPPGLLPPVAAAVVLAAYGLVPLAAGAVAFLRRDVR